ncbi:MAG TPA: hemerythrin domain-containing protein [Candidatus Aquilonibacter sp.]
MLDVYAKIHKAQRAWFGRLLIAASAVDPDDIQAATAIHADVQALVGHLHAHAEHEDRFIDPLLREVSPSLSVRLEDEHRRLAGVLDELAAFAGGSDLAGTYRALSLLAAQYFLHLDVEEYEAMPLLTQTFDDATIRSRIFAPFAASVPFEEAMRDLRLQLIALSPREGGELLAGMLAR